MIFGRFGRMVHPHQCGGIQRAIYRLLLLFAGVALPVFGASDVIYIPGGSQKLQQFIGNTDFQTGQPTLSESGTLYQLQNTDLGVPFRYMGQTIVLFGDSNYPGTKDAYAHTTDTDPESGLTLTFFNSGSTFTPVTIPNIALTGFDVPIYGIDVNGSIYLYYATDSNPSVPTMGRTVVAVSTNGGATFSGVLYTLSSNLFINVSVLEVNCADWPGLPQTNGLGLLIFGSGSYRKSDIYLAFQPEASIANPSTILYMAGLDTNSNPTWSSRESNSVAVTQVAFTNSQGDVLGVGELSATFNVFLKKWMLLYNLTGQIQFKTADVPWGPYTPHGVSFDPVADNGFTNFIYLAGANDLNLCNPNVASHDTSTDGGVYGPYVFNSFTLGNASQTNIETTLYHSMSTWNPYNSVLMRAQFARRPPPVIFAGNRITNIVTTSMSGGADAFVQSGTNADLNFGANTLLVAKNNGANTGDVSRKIFLRFPVNLPPNQRVAEASLSMTVGTTPTATAPFTYEVYGLRYNSAGQNWSETNVTWNTAPANLTNDGELLDPAQAIFLGSFRTTTNRVLGGAAAFSSMMLVDFLNQNSNAPATLIISRLTINSQVEQFASRENTNTPPALTFVTLPTLANQIVLSNTSSGVLPFQVDSGATNASNLIVTASSSNPSLLPKSGITLSGSGANRAIMLTPVVNQTGAASVTLTVSDGIATKNKMTFGVTVSGRPTVTPLSGVENPFRISINGIAGPTYLIEDSSDLLNWNILLITNPATLPFIFSDTNPPNPKGQFYRAVITP